uniref:ZF(RING/C6HC)-6 zinc finger protein n=1 Tax=Phallusia mammillata TaxID=59560 RepID=A0A6F9DRM9_9ASCI|nr:ZF(RING/C6HC)-6 zinc finger protein [Phallusia mammillata]
MFEGLSPSLNKETKFSVARSLHALGVNNLSPILSTIVKFIRLMFLTKAKMQEECLPREKLELAVKGLVVPKDELRNLVARIVLASTQWSRYHRINVPTILENNSKRGGLNLQKLIGALEVLEKYGKNLMKPVRPSQWRTVRLSNSVFKNKVDIIMGARDILQLLGYTKKIEDGFTFPDMISSPNMQEVLTVTSDIVLLKLELSMLSKNAHPKSHQFLPHFNAMDSLQQHPSTALETYGNVSTESSKESMLVSFTEMDYEIDKMCAVCGQILAEFRCCICNKLQCEKCDKIWHQNPNRVKHLRTRFRPLVSGLKTSTKSVIQIGTPTEATTSPNFQGPDDKINWENKILEKAAQLLDVKDINTRHQHLNQFCLEVEEQIAKYVNGAKQLGNSSLLLSRHLLERAESLETAKAELLKQVSHKGDKGENFSNSGSFQTFSQTVDSELNLPGVRGPPSSIYVPSSPHSIKMQGPAVLKERGFHGSKRVESLSVEINPMTLEDILFQTKAEDHRLQCSEMVDFLREAEGIGCDPLVVESLVASYPLQFPEDCLSEWLRKKLNAEVYQTTAPVLSEKIFVPIQSSKVDCWQILANQNTPSLKQFQERIGKHGSQTIADFLKMEDKLHMQHALMATFSLESESVAVMVSALLCHTCDKVPFLTMTNCDFIDVIEAAESFPDNLDGAVKYLQNQCMLCLEVFARSKVECMTTCGDNECKYCHTCLKRYLNYKISEGHIRDIVCPVCGLPDIDGDEETTTNYFNYLDVVVRTRLNDSLHTMFQQKLRDQTLMKMPNFRWCSYCTNGFLFEHEETTLKMVCPSCNKATCYNCKKQWEVQHEGISCEEFLDWKRMNDPDFQAAGLAAHLKENGIDCPSCKFRYALAKGGCMHFKCLMCSFQFCSGCKSPFRQGKVCTLLPTCHKKGFHAHHPRDCLFYLRDMEVEKLQDILNRANIRFGTEGVTTNMYCQVLEQKETSTGLEDDFCGREVHNENVGLCKLHYKEYLVNLINDNKLDPANVFSVDELITCLSRVESSVPKPTVEMTEREYASVLLLQVKELPLTHQRVGVGHNFFKSHHN